MDKTLKIAKTTKIKHNYYMILRKKISILLSVLLLIGFMTTIAPPKIYATDSPNQNDKVDDISERKALDILNCMENKLSSDPAADQEAIYAECSNDNRKVLTNCNVEDTIGWLLCPFATFIGTAADSSFEFIKDFFELDVDKIFSESSPAKQIWKKVRNIANTGIFVLLIMIVISQITNFGISNYGLKKMLPKIIAAVILINLSYIIVQIAIDLSNILGQGIASAFGIMTQEVFGGLEASEGSSPGAIAKVTGSILSLVVVVMALSFAKLKYARISIIFPIITMFIMTIVICALFLVTREAVGIVLVATAPIAFLSLIFPNAENIYKIWKKALLAVIMMFPIMGALFGAGLLISGILTQSSDSLITKVIACVMPALPLIFMPTLIKNSISSLPLLGSKMTNLTNKMRNKTVDAAKNSQLSKHSEKKYAAKMDRIKSGEQRPGLSLAGHLVQRANANPITAAGREAAAERNERNQERISGLGNDMSTKDANLVKDEISKYGNLDRLDLNSFSEKTQQALATNGLTASNTDQMAAAAMLNLSKTGDLDIDNFNAMSLYANSGKNRLGQSTMDHIGNTVKQDAAKEGRYDLEGHVKGLEDLPGGVNNLNIVAHGQKKTFQEAQITKNLGTKTPDELAKMSKDTVSTGSVGAKAFNDYYHNNSDFKNTVNSSLSSDNISAESATAMRNAI